MKSILATCSRLVFWLLFLCLTSLQVRLSEMAIARALVKPGDDFTFDRVPGRLLVQRVTKSHDETQYLWAGQCCDAGAWTTDGNNRIGNATLEWATGKMTIKNFASSDVGRYTFPLEEPREHLAKTVLIIEMDRN